MRKTIRLGLAMALAVATTPAFGHPPDQDPYDPGAAPASHEDADEATPMARPDGAAATPQETATASGEQAATAREGAGGMEPEVTPSATETREDRDERELVNDVWSSP